MMSLNFYPEIKKQNHRRLSAHKDVSLLSVFPYGISNGLCIVNENGDEINIPPTKNLIAFPGFLIELLSKGKIKALQHHVNFDELINLDRYSYDIFSIPTPNINLPIININSDSSSINTEYGRTKSFD
jgi:isopenicillin N synthase-like dioxygenase